jgi:hypothetical protein
LTALFLSGVGRIGMSRHLDALSNSRSSSCWRFLNLLLVASLSACGGGGSASSQPPPTAPQITTQPASLTVTAGATAHFAVAATGTSPLKYQWQRNGAVIAGATTPTYATPAVAIGDTGLKFGVVVSNAIGSVSSVSAVLTVSPASPLPRITTQPTNQAVSVGQSAVFDVVASGAAPLQYQWQKSGSAIVGATGSSYTAPAATLADNGSSFAVVVNNGAGSVTSVAAMLTVTAAGIAQGTDVVTYKYDVMRTGLNATESVLTPANVRSATFGKLQNLSVDGLVDAQPLYLSNLTVNGAGHNVLFVATEHDSLYAFDVDTGKTLWHVSLLSSGETPSDDRGCDQVTPEIGITSTPVVDRTAGVHGTLYVVAMSKDNSSVYHQRLHALDITTGAEVAAGPTTIAATYGSTTFAPGQYAERAALLLANGTVYTSWTSHCDQGEYGGWIIAFNQANLGVTSAINVAKGATGSGPASEGPAIWMSGGGPAADTAGNVYVLTANGRFETMLVGGFPSGGDYGNSFLKISSATGSLSIADYFTMSGEVAESSSDQDLGSGGIMLLPDMTDASGSVRQLAVGAGKDGNIYVVNREDMGHFTSVGNDIWQELDSALPGGVFATPAYFNSSIFYGPQGGSLKAFSLTDARLSSSPTSQTSTLFPYPGTLPVVSSNGTANAIVWAYENSAPAVLHAYSAGNLAQELYNSSQAPNGRDHFGSGNKFIAPVVAGGKVFVATTSSVAVFGLLP